MATTSGFLKGLALAGGLVTAYSNISFNKQQKREEAQDIESKTNKIFEETPKDKSFSVGYYPFRSDNERTFAGHSAMSVDIDGSPVNHYGLHPDKLFGVMPTSLLFGSVAKTSNSYEQEIELEEFPPEKKIEIPVSYETAHKINELMNKKRMDVAENKVVFSIFPTSVVSSLERNILGKEVENCALSVSRILKEGGIIDEETRVPETLVTKLKSLSKE